MIEAVSFRLRSLRDRNGWTVADMAERTGIPKRTLDKYMLRSGASLPGFDALCLLSKGLGVSLDWLVFGSEGASPSVELIVERASHAAGRAVFETILREFYAKNGAIVSGERILNLTPEDWAGAVGDYAKEEAAKMIAEGITYEELLNWRNKKLERVHELFVDMVSELLPDVKLPTNLANTKRGTGN
ncbi:helix-turn-helix transcriptional regulator [Paracoccaceae bacterium Fryx2]|nr:helix-turn-helix transcriptional regulator [Paracoccaceae bacterium Fryx2]